MSSVFPSLAADVKPEVLMEYIKFIEKKTNYTYHGEALPRILTTDTATLLKAYEKKMRDYGFPEDKIAEEISEITFINGMYIPEINVLMINLENGYDPTQRSSSDLMVHELTHYMQTINPDKDPECGPETEVEAYKTQLMWDIERYFVDDDRLLLAYRGLNNNSIMSMICSYGRDDPLR
jgi:hypothetical protein